MGLLGEMFRQKQQARQMQDELERTRPMRDLEMAMKQAEMKAKEYQEAERAQTFDAPSGYGAPTGLKLNRAEALKSYGDAFEKKQAAAKGAASVAGMTPGRKSADMAFGKDYTDWSSGGFSQAQKGMDALKAARSRLAPPTAENPEGVPATDISGGIRGAMPDWARAVTNPDALAVKEDIRGAVMNTLRATLGSAFTDKEGERIFNLAYNDRLPEAENVKRLDRVFSDLQRMTEAKQGMSDHFERTGTLTGWQGRMPVITDPDAAPAQAQGGIATGGLAPVPGALQIGQAQQIAPGVTMKRVR